MSMNKEDKTKLSFLNKHSIKFFMRIFLPSLLAIISIVTITVINFHTNKTRLQNSAISAFTHFTGESEKKLLSTIYSVNNLANDETFRKALKNNVSGLATSDIVHINTLLAKFKNTSGIVDEICILDQTDKKVISTSSTYDTKTFFEEKYIYNSYNYAYFESFNLFTPSAYQILSPTTVNYEGATKNVIPIILRKIDNTYAENIIILNVDISAFLVPGSAYSFTKNIQLYLLNNYTGFSFSNYTDIPTVFEPDDELYKKILSNKKDTKIKTKDTGNATIVSFSPSNTLSGYTYYAIIPTADILYESLLMIVYSILITIFTIGFTLYFSLKNTTKTYTPIKQMADVLTPGKNFDLELIKNSAINMHTANNNMSTILPYAVEKYLINYLNSTEYSIDEQSQSIIKDILPFKYNYFAVVIIHLIPTGKFYDTYTSIEYDNIQSGFYSLVKVLFAEKFDTVPLSCEKETLYIILNTKDNSGYSEITSIIDDIYSYLQNDIEYIKLTVGFSNIHESLTGIKDAHKEALSMLKLLPKRKNQIILSRNDNDEISFTFTNTHENNLFTAIVNLKIDKAFKIIETIESENISLNNHSKRRLYMLILSTVHRAMRVKNISLPNDILDFEVINEVSNQPIDEIKNEIITTLQYLQESHSANNTGITDLAIKYIDNNFNNPNISLEHIAAHFHTNSSYISAALSKTLGIGFHEYLTQLRVAHAKNLLLQTTKTVQEISNECGYATSQTFYRVFKNVTGSTPNSYRSQIKKGNQTE